MNYWEQRLSKDYNFVGVGDYTLGLEYNQTLYKIRRLIFNKLLRQLNINKHARILDVGSGTGFYIGEYSKNKLTDVLGLDIAESAIARLKQHYSNYKFMLGDISNIKDKTLQNFDFIFAFDILFHIVNDKDYEQAILNINNALKSDGKFIFSDYQGIDSEIRLNHFVVRTKGYLQNCLLKNNFKIIKQIPVFVLFNRPYSAPQGFFRKLINLHLLLISKHKIYSIIMRKLLYPLELLLLKFSFLKPSTIIWICEKIK